MLNVMSILQPSAEAECAVSVGGSRTTAVAGGREVHGGCSESGSAAPGAGEAYARFRAVLPHKVWEFCGIRGFEDDLPTETLESFDC